MNWLPHNANMRSCLQSNRKHTLLQLHHHVDSYLVDTIDRDNCKYSQSIFNDVP